MNEIKVKAKETEDDLKDLGPEMPNDSSDKQQLLFTMATDFIQTYKNTLSGKYDQKRYASSGGAKQEISGGAKIKMNFYNLY